MRHGRSLFDWDLNPFIVSKSSLKMRFSDGAGGEGGSVESEGKEGDLGAAGGDNGAGGNTNNDDGSKNQPRTFTQEEVTRMMTAEKNQGRQSVLKELGITDPTQAKTLLEMAAKIADATKPPDQKITEEGLKAKTAEQRAEAAEQKLELALAKVNADVLDDVWLLAKARMDDKTDFRGALEVVKKTHPGFFDSEAENGTGGPPSSKRKAGAVRGEYGKRAAAAAKASQPKKPGEGFFQHT